MPFFLLILLINIVVGLLGTTRRIGFLIPFLLSWLITPVGATLLVVLSGPRIRNRQKRALAS